MASGLIYFSIFAITGLLSEISSKISEKSQLGRLIKKLFMILTLSIPAFFAGIRFGIGVDYFNYVTIFNNASFENISRIEPGYNIINIIIKELGGNEHVLFFVVSFLTWYFIYKLLLKYKDEISVGLGMFIALLLFYHFSFNIVRQMLAVSISLYSFSFIDEKKLGKFYITVLIAASIHGASIIIAPFYYLYNNLGNKRLIYQILIYIFVFIGILNYSTIVEFISEYILKDQYYLKYALQGEPSFGIGLFIIFAPYLLPGILFYNRFSDNDKSFRLYFFLTVISFILRLIGYFGAEHLNRIAYFLNVASIWLVPYYWSVMSNKLKWFWIPLASIFGVILYWYLTFIIDGGAGTVPYNTIF